MSDQQPIAAEHDVAARWTPISRLHAWDKNPRHNEAAVEKVAESIRRFGWGSPILAREETGSLVAGDTRLKAQAHLSARWFAASDEERQRWRSGYPDDPASWHPDAIRCVEHSEVPVRFGTWSEREAHLLAIADNRLGEIATWDAPLLAEVLSGYAEVDALVAGFAPGDLDKLLAELQPAEPEDDGGGKSTGALAQQYVMPPFSVLSAREGAWQDRKRAWIALGIRSELGRGGAVGEQAAGRTYGQDLMRGEHVVGA